MFFSSNNKYIFIVMMVVLPTLFVSICVCVCCMLMREERESEVRRKRLQLQRQLDHHRRLQGQNIQSLPITATQPEFITMTMTPMPPIHMTMTPICPPRSPPPFGQMHQPPPLATSGGNLSPPLPPTALQLSSSAAPPTPYPTAPNSATTPGWNVEAMKPKAQPGILITPKYSDRSVKSLTRVNLTPAVIHHVLPQKRNARSLQSLQGRAKQENRTSSSSSRTGSGSSRNSKRGQSSRRRH